MSLLDVLGMAFVSRHGKQCVSGWTLYAVDGSFSGCTGYGRLSDSFLRYFTAYLDTLAWPLALSNMRRICQSLTVVVKGG